MYIYIYTYRHIHTYTYIRIYIHITVDIGLRVGEKSVFPTSFGRGCSQGNLLSFTLYPILGVEIARARRCLSTLCRQSNPQICHRVLKPPLLPIKTKVKGIELQPDEIVTYIHTNIQVNATVRLRHPRSGYKVNIHGRKIDGKTHKIYIFIVVH